MTHSLSPSSRVRGRVIAGLLAAMLLPMVSFADMQAKLIPREVLFGNPDRVSPQISPDGSKLAWLAEKNGVLNVFVAPVGKLDQARAVTDDKDRGIRIYYWAYTSDHVLYLQDKGGDENWRVYVTNVDTAETRDLTPLPGVQARIQEVSHKAPNDILIALNDRPPHQLHDIYRVNILTGEKTLVQRNDEGFVGYLTDDDYAVRFGAKMTPDGGQELLKRDGDAWETFITIPPADALTTGPRGFNEDGTILYMSDSRDRDTAAVVSVNLKTGQELILSADPKADAGEMLVNPQTKVVEAVAYNYLTQQWDITHRDVAPDFAYLRTVAKGELNITSRSHDNQHWIVAYVQSDGPVRYYHYDRSDPENLKAAFLFTNRSDLENEPLVPMHPLIIKTRDGLDMVSYLTLPPGSDPDNNARPDKPVPMVLFVHGGPWARDEWGYNPYHQWLANRGYAVLSVNFRSSTGFGKSFINAGNLEWGRKMQDDLTDAVKWAVKEKIAKGDKVAIMGGSYGGYATLAGLTFTPEVYACGVDIVGPSNLVTLLKSIPPYWKPMLDVFATRVGDYRTESGEKLLQERSPLTFVDRIGRPLLIGQGANDPRVKQAESDQIVEAMHKKQIPVTYVLFPDEGHGFAKPENRIAFNAVAEAFLAQHLGGRAEPFGDAFKGASITVPAGADQVPQLAQSLRTE